MGDPIDFSAWAADIVKSWTPPERQPPPTCPSCDTPYELRRKFNSGNPIDLWLPECDCEDRAAEAEIDERLRKRKH